MNFLFLMDPYRVNPNGDTSFAFMEAAEHEGHRIFRAEPQHLSYSHKTDGTGLHVIASEASTDRIGSLTQGTEPILIKTAPKALPLTDFDAVFIRKDPPFDEAYLFCTQLLDLAPCFVLNHPRGVRDANEKLFALYASDVMAETMVSSDEKAIKQFVHDVGGKAVLKPLSGKGGEGIFVLTHGDFNLHSIVETMTAYGTRLAMVQRFLPEVRQGDKRILLLDGKPLGAFVRIPASDDIRGNLRVGGRIEKSSITPRDQEILERVTPLLKAHHLYFVGLDIVGGFLTEINVTSPTGLQQMSKLENRDLAKEVIDFVVSRVHAKTQ